MFLEWHQSYWQQCLRVFLLCQQHLSPEHPETSAASRGWQKSWKSASWIWLAVCSVCIYFCHLAEAARRLYQQPGIVQRCHSSSWYRLWAGHPGCSCCSQAGNYRRILGTELSCRSLSLWDWVKNVASKSPLRALPSLQLLCWEIPSCVWFSWNVQPPGEFAVTLLEGKMEWAQGSVPEDCRGWVCKAKSCSQRTLTFVLVTIEWILSIFQAHSTENVQLCSADPQPVQLSCISTADTFKLFPCSLKGFC